MIGIDFHDYSAQLVELKLVNNQFHLESYNRITIPPSVIREGEIVQEDNLKLALTNLLKTANPRPIESKNIAVIFPSSKVFSHIFTFPANLNEEDVKKSLPYEAETVIPYSINDVYWDFTTLYKENPKLQHASQQVMFVAIIKETADKYVDLLRSLDLVPSLLGVDVESLQYGIRQQADPTKPSLIIDIGTLATNYLILQNGIIKHYFSENSGGKHLINEISREFQTPEILVLEQKEKGTLDIKYQTQITEFLAHRYKTGIKILNSYLLKHNLTNISDIFLTGEFLNLPQYKELAEEHIGKGKFAIGDPRKYLIIENNKFENNQNTSSNTIPYSTYFINAVGIAARGLLHQNGKGINLLPDSLKESYLNRRYSLSMAISSILIAIISLSVTVFLFFQHQNLTYTRLTFEIQKSAIDKVIFGTRYQEIRREIDSFNKEVSELSEINNSLFSLPKTMENINKLIPKEIKITAMEYSDMTLSFDIAGIAETREALLKTHQNLKSAPFIEEVITPISNYDAKSNISFTLTIKLIFKELPRYGTN